MKRLLKILNTYDVALVSFGLAPNPNGFCFEAEDSVDKAIVTELGELLGQLTLKEEKYLKVNYM